ncbi:hypothetical protein HYH02_001376 [Chlamydomonas schloesseri]|uniref:Uncharacterized protein n=1 Tax=Chlamydomonas schloesseri TaxID=2026947 RepID=A0A835WXE4_9CHLO|nr:hypothetical protein HYH02_001376 [Chlamydomonas schloesseri]|eukprot:KAG2454351.1 hypothetical protein HYH02_001376 [Chlamydomonas schloesseri]
MATTATRSGPVDNRWLLEATLATLKAPGGAFNAGPFGKGALPRSESASSLGSSLATSEYSSGPASRGPSDDGRGEVGGLLAPVPCPQTAIQIDTAPLSLSSTDHQRVLTPLLDSGLKRAVFATTSLLMAVAGVYFAGWRIAAVEGRWTAMDGAICIMAMYEALQSSICLALILRAKIINPKMQAMPPRYRVAMIATKAPSEPLSVLQKTLSAMLDQDYPYPYDVWLADERPDEETRAWCAEHGVRISTRQGVPEYHQAQWPRRTRCKEGNLAYFYDHYGYEQYDVVAQFDADHVPSRSYLSSVTPAFQDPKIGYAACPSICGANRDASWAVRGRLYEEAYFHGPWGASTARDLSPFCIGSHYVVRTAALKQAGGIGPELDEDMSTSYIMTANGFKGAFALNTIAHGDGPVNFEDAMRQEYQWSRSAMMILCRYMYPWWGRSYKLTVAERVRIMHWMFFWFSWSAWAVLPHLVITGLAFGLVVPAAVGAGMLALHGAPMLLAQYAHWLAARSFGWLRPVDAPVCMLTWEVVLHKALKPYWILMGTTHGLLGGLFGMHFDIKVTPKGDRGQSLIGLRCVAPMLLSSAFGFAVAAFVAPAASLGYLMALWFVGAMGAVLAAVVVVLHCAENHSLRALPWDNLAVHATVLLAVVTLGGFAVLTKGWGDWSIVE